MTTQTASRDRARLISQPFGIVLRRAHRHTAKLVDRLTRAVELQDEAKVKFLIGQVLRSSYCKIEALSIENRHVCRRFRIPRQELIASALQLDPWQGFHEPVRVKSRPKSQNRWRPITVFSVRQRALHRLLKIALEPWVRGRLHDRQRALQGGRNEAVKSVATRIENSGFKFATELDVGDFYQTVRLDWLKTNLPLPEEVIAKVIAPGSWDLTPVDAHAHGLMHACRKGISQGSVVSPLIAEFVISEVLKSASQEVVFENFADNLLVLANSREVIKRQASSLADAFEAHPSGYFSLKYRQGGPRRVCDGFAFLGYDLKKRSGFSRVQITPSKTNIGCIIERLHREGGFAVASSVLRSWCSAFRLAHLSLLERDLLGFSEFAAEHAGEHRTAWLCLKQYRLARYGRLFFTPRSVEFL